jgi:HSP20 family protein
MQTIGRYERGLPPLLPKLSPAIPVRKKCREVDGRQGDGKLPAIDFLICIRIADEPERTDQARLPVTKVEVRITITMQAWNLSERVSIHPPRSSHMNVRSLAPFTGNRPVSRRPEETDPFLAFRRDMNRLFDDFFGGFGSPGLFDPFRFAGALPGGMPSLQISPRIDMSETDRQIRIVAELPGVDERDIEVSVSDDVLTIRGQRKAEREEEKTNYHLVERSQGSFSRAIFLPFTIDPEQVQATFKNGVLTLTIPKPKEVQDKVHRIEIKKEEDTTDTKLRQIDRAAAGDKPMAAGEQSASAGEQASPENKAQESAAK